MTFDEPYLEMLTISLQGVYGGIQRRMGAIDHALEMIRKIALQKDGSMPLDPDTGQPMTQARRDEIYDACLPQINQLLGINTPAPDDSA